MKATIKTAADYGLTPDYELWKVEVRFEGLYGFRVTATVCRCNTTAPWRVEVEWYDSNELDSRLMFRCKSEYPTEAAPFKAYKLGLEEARLQLSEHVIGTALTRRAADKQLEVIDDAIWWLGDTVQDRL